MKVKIEKTWAAKLKNELESQYFTNLESFLSHEYQHQEIFPPMSDLYKAFELCPFEQTRVVIIGQDPYHGKGQANGLSFSVPEGSKIPPSLMNIYKELASDLGVSPNISGNLERWAKQGILLLNATMTVRAKEPNSHQNKGWETFTDAVIRLISAREQGVVFLLWGAFAQKKEQLINTEKHLVLKSAHPSPLSAYRGFMGNKHFSKTNNFLKAKGFTEIQW